ncbi:hypothetical protein [Shewanella sp. 6_MG-2023]|uniref:hypothetical protein n=1 Tax=Shewanella sp. 6_MG-2023 TaxID=3062660 RepID=UPI0026E11860|nr:hypothetical protein [Shewanella sp. 6_MG-2023]MDO6620854.1 hypothetical protein [Shewanella sp. 6_MG-2023]
MKKTLLLSIFLLSACGGSNSDGSSKETYSSCQITASSALLASDMTKDLSQCWNASGNGYESQEDALQWCRQTVENYIASTYIVGHDVQFIAKSTYCAN